jgi:RHS repeat-associated protein
MQLALSTTFAPPSIPVWDELSGNLRQGFTTKNQDWNPGPNVVNSTSAIGFWPSLFLDGVRQSHSARYYNPLTGRFMSRDPNEPQLIGPDKMPIDPKKLHKYLYAGGDPINNIDPSGRDLVETGLIDAGETEEGVAAYREYRDVVRTACIAVYISLWEGLDMYKGVSPAVVYDEAKNYCYAIIP